jgi:hypothetical protein
MGKVGFPREINNGQWSYQGDWKIIWFNQRKSSINDGEDDEIRDMFGSYKRIFRSLMKWK